MAQLSSDKPPSSPRAPHIEDSTRRKRTLSVPVTLDEELAIVEKSNRLGLLPGQLLVRTALAVTDDYVRSAVISADQDVVGPAQASLAARGEIAESFSSLEPLGEADRRAGQSVERESELFDMLCHEIAGTASHVSHVVTDVEQKIRESQARMQAANSSASSS